LAGPRIRECAWTRKVADVAQVIPMISRRSRNPRTSQTPHGGEQTNGRRAGRVRRSRLADAHRLAGHRMGDAVLIPLRRDPGRQAHRPIASFTHYPAAGPLWRPYVRMLPAGFAPATSHSSEEGGAWQVAARSWSRPMSHGRWPATNGHMLLSGQQRLSARVRRHHEALVRGRAPVASGGRGPPSARA
jgi:hypothetical protein